MHIGIPSSDFGAKTLGLAAEFVIRFGIIRLVGPNQFKLMQETTRIPKLTRSHALALYDLRGFRPPI